MSDDPVSGPGLSGAARGRATAVAALAVVLGATSLHAVLTTQQWFWPMVLAVAVVAAVGALARRTGLPVVLHPLVALAALLVVLTTLYAHDQAWAGFVPTSSSLGRLGTLVGDGATDLRTLLAPTYPSAQLKLLAVGGVGIIALAVDLLAVSGRRPTLAGAPLILLVAVPSAIRERSVGYVSLCAAAVGFLLLLTLDGEDRTTRWGRVLPNAGDGGIGPSATGTAGPALRIGIVALLVAVAVPFAIPGAHVSRFATAGGTGNGGGGRAVIVDPLVSVSTELTEQSDKPLLTVKSGIPTYQRITALEVFNDAGFGLGAVTAPTSAQVKHGLAPEPFRVPHTEITQRITASDTLAQALLPVPIGTADVDIHGDWRLYAPTRTIFSASTNTRGSSWTVTADLPAPAPSLLRAGGLVHRPESSFPSSLAVDLQVPNDLPPVVLSTAESWTKGAATAYDAAVDIQRHFTSGEFTYDTTVGYVAGPQGFSQFLADKRGFCEQYATTMAAMMRALGVPARVAIGFTAGKPDKAGNTWTITGADAHAWPEIWFDDAGWVRFEPTPLSGGRALTPPYTGGRTLGGPTPPPSSAPTVVAPGASASQPAKLDRQPGDRSGGGAASTRPTGGGIAGPVWAGVGVLVLVLLLLVPFLAAWTTRRRRLANGRGPELVWRQLLDDAADRLVLVRPSDSPRMVGRRLRAVLGAGAGASPPVVAALGRLVSAVEQARYAAPDQARLAERDSTLAADERAVSAALSQGLPWTQRLVATVMPASARARLLAPPARSGLALLDGLDRLGRLLGRRQAPSV